MVTSSRPGGVVLLLGSVGSDQTVVVVPALGGGHALAIIFWIRPVKLPL